MTTKTKTHFLTIMIDLSKPEFADADMAAKLNVVQVLAGFAEGVAYGSEGSLAKGKDGKALGFLMIAEDAEDGGGRKAFDAAADALQKAVELQEKLQRKTG